MPGQRLRAAQRGEVRWRGMPVRAALLHVAIYVVPIAMSVVVAFAVSRLLPRSGFGSTAVWWLAVAIPATLTLWTTDRLLRRLLPLAVLLRLSLLFPDRAPARYAIARASRSTPELERRIAAAKKDGVPIDPGRAAETLLTLVAALGVHDRRTRGHSERVRIYVDMIAEELRLPPGDRDRLRWAALIHDIGKLSVPGGILNKPTKPSRSEWEVLRTHPREGARLAAGLLPWLGEWGQAILHHHERFDGKGYPAGLTGGEISLAGRILSVADSYEVMTAARSYKRPMSAAAGREELVRCAGHHFDPVVVRAFLNISLVRLRLAMGPLSWLAQLPFLPRVAALPEAAVVTKAAVGGAAAIGMMSVLESAPPAPPHPTPVTAEAATPIVPVLDRAGAPTPESDDYRDAADRAHTNAEGPPDSVNESVTSTEEDAAAPDDATTTTASPSGDSPSDPQPTSAPASSSVESSSSDPAPEPAPSPTSEPESSYDWWVGHDDYDDDDDDDDDDEDDDDD
jgi:HD-GYP domain-containing protein (c-di-GMP phosphodiesterase class II)